MEQYGQSHMWLEHSLWNYCWNLLLLCVIYVSYAYYSICKMVHPIRAFHVSLKIGHIIKSLWWFLCCWALNFGATKACCGWHSLHSAKYQTLTNTIHKYHLQPLLPFIKKKVSQHRQMALHTCFVQIVNTTCILLFSIHFPTFAIITTSTLELYIIMWVSSHKLHHLRNFICKKFRLQNYIH